MLKDFENHAMKASFLLADQNDLEKATQLAAEHLAFWWNCGPAKVQVLSDDQHVALHPGHILCSTHTQHVKITKIPAENQMYFLAFNRPFYCVHTNDAEVSCNGLLFFGSNYAPVLSINADEERRLTTLLKVLQEEFDTEDQNREEMLRILLKRLIIRCTRVARKQLLAAPATTNELDLMRQYQSLVEEHFREYHQVRQYAEMMHRAPKTIANFFSTHSPRSALQVIHDRLILEAKRLLLYSDCSTQQIAWQLGFSDPSQFSRFFKKQTTHSPTHFRKSGKTG